MNNRPFIEWSDQEPTYAPTGCLEAEYIGESGRIESALISLFHYADASKWGHTTGDWRDKTYKVHHPDYYRWRFTGPEVPTPAAQGQMMCVWQWWDAPSELRALSPHGGDEDYVALLPKDASQPSWMDTGTSFGCCDVSEHELPDGRRVFIGAHA